MRNAILLSALAAPALGGSKDAWPPSAYTRARAYLATLSQDQKITLVHGNGKTDPCA
jgi:hypothetical protein